MQPDNTSQPQPTPPVAPNNIVIGGIVTPQTTQAPLPQPASQPPVKPTTTNYAAAVFFTLLIVGFTFHLPSLLYLPVIFFCAVAGVLFFRDTLAARKAAHTAQGQAAYYSASAVPVKKRNPLITLLLIIFGVIGAGIILYVGFIVFILIMLGASGV